MSDVAALEVRDLHKYFGTHEVLKGIDMTAHKGDVISLIGSSGSGKSTFLRCINLLEKPTSGSVFIDGQDISKITEKELRTVRYSVGMIFQQFNLLMQRTAERNIKLPMEIAGVDK